MFRLGSDLFEVASAGIIKSATALTSLRGQDYPAFGDVDGGLHAKGGVYFWEAPQLV